MRWRLAAATSLRVATYMEARHHPQQGALASKRQVKRERSHHISQSLQLTK
ncbi:hypothetical protein PAHAL_2G381400 [Panicum hallii]|uniref:Uncharacterized protein n=1 Tax=Panicum hallii TaxID=206008 RepID=A0A2T8KRU0_9POAL|nr:hypothetical protein PAHAL_2G381400 [Panicum hallii]